MSYLIGQEAWLSFYAERLGVTPADLGERDIRLALALYHGAYLPTAATVELRANELDQEQRYLEFGFEPNTPSFATGKVKVVLPTASGTGYTLSAPFVVRQGDLAFIATERLTIPAGSNSGEAAIIAQLQGEGGTPQEATATITVSAGWLRGATISITDVSPGRDGDTTDVIRSEFRAYAFNPQALVRADDHADWVTNNYSDIGKATAFSRTRLTYNSGIHNKQLNVAGHMSLVLVGSDGGIPEPALISSVKEAMLLTSIPYGSDALHLVPGLPASVTGTITAVMEPGLDEEEVKTAVVEALAEHLSWRTWPSGRAVYAGDLWAVVAAVPGVDHVTGLSVGSGNEMMLQPWQHPESGYTINDIILSVL